MRKDYIVLIVGKSGSGKSEICNYLKSTYGIKELKSYTTRPCRGVGDNSHTFISDEEFDELVDMCAYTEYNGYRYCATDRQVEESDIYIIDPAGIEYFYKTYNGSKIPMVVYISAYELVRRNRMCFRGNSIAEANERIELDRNVFKGIDDVATYVYHNNDDNMDDVIRVGELIYHTFFDDRKEE